MKTMRNLITVIAAALMIIGCSKDDDGNSGSNGGLTAVKVTDSIGTSASTEIHTAVFDGKLWIIGGNTGNTVYDEVWNTTNGEEWIEAQAIPGTTYYHSALSFDGKMWVLCGHDGNGAMHRVLSSADGQTWTAEFPIMLPARYDHTSLVFDGKMWIIGGTFGSSSNDYKNDVWYSSDGTTWAEATPNAAFSPRRGHTSIVYDGKMWVIGGQDATGYRNDVWYSSDGISWEEATSNADFPPRSQHLSETYNGKMWVISGDVVSETNDVWTSTDGKNWTREEFSGAPFTPRRFSSSAVYNDKLWIIAGYDNINGYVNDVWYIIE